MQKTIYLPTLETASARNRLLVTSVAPIDVGAIDFTFPEQRCPYTNDGTLKDLERKQSIARSITDLVLDDESDILQSGTFSTWDDLNERMCQVTDSYIDDLDLSEFSALTRGSDEETISHTKYAAAEGVATIVAFAEVIPRVMVHEEFEDPNTQLGKIALQSKGFIIEWLGIHNDVDYRLAYALAVKKPKDLEAVYKGLRFNSRWFKSDGGRVGLDPVRAENLRDWTTRTHPSAHLTSQDRRFALFGCPARKIVPVLYDAVTKLAVSGGLFEATYRQERANLGYEI